MSLVYGVLIVLVMVSLYCLLPFMAIPRTTRPHFRIELPGLFMSVIFTNITLRGYANKNLWMEFGPPLFLLVFMTYTAWACRREWAAKLLGKPKHPVRQGPDDLLS